MNDFFCSYQFLTILGLILDIAGIFILFYTGLPFKMPARNLYVEESLTEKQIAKNKKQKHIAYFGLSLLILGFSIQIIASLMSYYNS